MTFPPSRSLAALTALVVLTLPLILAGVASAQTSKITRQDCKKHTIRDKSGKPISNARCKRLIGKRVHVRMVGSGRTMQLAETGFEVWPFVAGGALCLAGAAAFGLRRRSPLEPL
jgi:LPXTG-motif cell wall-anchored protein